MMASAFLGGGGFLAGHFADGAEGADDVVLSFQLVSAPLMDRQISGNLCII